LRKVFLVASVSNGSEAARERSRMIRDLGSRTVLAVQDIHAKYYKKKILQGVSLELQEGEIACIIGLNGAGKSTLLKVIAGVLPASRGSVFLRGEDVSKLATDSRVKKGIGYFVQGGEVFTNLTVGENLELGGLGLTRSGLRERMNEICGLFSVLSENRGRRAGLLSGGERQMLALGIVLMRHPGVLLLDEPSAGLAPAMVKQMAKHIRDINQKLGVSILLVEQNIREALKISSRVYLLKRGVIVGTMASKDLVEGRLEETLFGEDWVRS